ncbi:hypothetical protein [Leptospira harrisiae]|uniref:Uncharacterized protein n=1 Tax=Leptospira harrisiae TaxID=2023189 RepID=A0A2N0AM46_9LEPT|nr:hypothetical protein [Leptospira harrisiae]PJZ85379.1 hypothetical protein CH364_03820 [Leptospira harrisiae]PKA08915.1 hypothetical protein CH366_03960 [Leptospira harrisiae]
MKKKLAFVHLFTVLFFQCSEKQIPVPSELKVLADAYHSGHLTVVSSILTDKKKERELLPLEEVLYTKTLFYLGDWKEFFSHWSELTYKTPELVLLYFKAVIVSKFPITISAEDESKLIELLPISPEACLLYLKLKNSKHPNQQKKLFLDQAKQFQTHLDRLEKELEITK